jgi:hypothetical protein
MSPQPLQAPPFTSSVAPVMKPFISLAKKTTARASERKAIHSRRGALWRCVRAVKGSPKNETRRDGVDADPRAPELRCQRARECEHGAFRRAVCERARVSPLSSGE